MSNTGPITVLIVEDHKPFRNMLREFLLLRFPALEIHETGCGACALRKISLLAPQLVLIDIGLPDISGLEVARDIASLATGTSVVVMSTMAGIHVAKSAIAAGAAAFIDKQHLYEALPGVIARLGTADEAGA